MPKITVYVSEDLNNRMKARPNTKWSAIAQKAFEGEMINKGLPRYYIETRGQGRNADIYRLYDRTCDSLPKSYIATIYSKYEAIRIEQLLNQAVGL